MISKVITFVFQRREFKSPRRVIYFVMLTKMRFLSPSVRSAKHSALHAKLICMRKTKNILGTSTWKAAGNSLNLNKLKN